MGHQLDKNFVLSRINITDFYLRFIPSLKVKSGSESTGKCIFHDDKRDSFSVNLDSGLWTCHAGCGGGSVFDFYSQLNGTTFAEAVSLLAEENGVHAEPTKKPVIVATYDYTNESGELLFQVVRYDPKDFRQRRPDEKGGWIYKLDTVSPVLYRLPEVSKASVVVIVEGEKDVETLRSIGITATTSPRGASAWQDRYADCLAGKNVAIIPDNDEPGRKYAGKIAHSLLGKANIIKIINLPGLNQKGDVTDWMKNGGTKDQLLELIKNTPEWVEEDAPAQEEETKEVKRKRDSRPAAIWESICQYWNDVESGKIRFIPACSLFSDDKGPTLEAYVDHHVNFLGAYTSSGKSTLFAQMTVEAARQGAKQLIFSVEDKREEKMMTMIAIMTGVHKRKQVLRKFSPEESERMSKAAAEIASWGLEIYDDVRTLPAMEAIIKKSDANIIGLDYIQNVSFPGIPRLYEQMSFAAHEVSRWASEYEKSFTILSQVSNDSVQNGSDLIALKGAGELAAIANAVLWMSKGRKEENMRRVTLSVRKNKVFGPCRDIELEFSEDWTRLQSLTAFPEVPGSKSMHKSRLDERRNSG